MITYGFDPAALKGITLKHNSHHRRSQGLCLMEAVAAIAGDEHTDLPKCTTHALAWFGQAINDHCDRINQRGVWDKDSNGVVAYRTRLLAPVIPDLLNTSSNARRQNHDNAYDPANDPHDQLVKKYITRRVKEEFPGTKFRGYDVVDSTYYLVVEATDKDVKPATMKRRLRKLRDILREGAEYAKSLLGENNTPVTIYASEDRPHSPVYDVFVDDVGEPEHVHIHQ